MRPSRRRRGRLLRRPEFHYSTTRSSAPAGSIWFRGPNRPAARSVPRPPDPRTRGADRRDQRPEEAMQRMRHADQMDVRHNSRAGYACPCSSLPSHRIMITVQSHLNMDSKHLTKMRKRARRRARICGGRRSSATRSFSPRRKPDDADQGHCQTARSFEGDMGAAGQRERATIGEGIPWPPARRPGRRVHH